MSWQSCTAKKVPIESCDDCCPALFCDFTVPTAPQHWMVGRGVSKELVAQFVSTQLIDQASNRTGKAVIQGYHRGTNHDDRNNHYIDFQIELPLSTVVAPPTVFGLAEAAQAFVNGCEDSAHKLDIIRVALVTQFADMKLLTDTLFQMLRREYQYTGHVTVSMPDTITRFLYADSSTARMMDCVNGSCCVNTFCWLTCVKPCFNCSLEESVSINQVVAKYTVTTTPDELCQMVRERYNPVTQIQQQLGLLGGQQAQVLY